MTTEPDLTTRFADAVNAAGRTADMNAIRAIVADIGPELERLRGIEADLSGAVWVHPGIRGGTPCVGGTRVPVDNVAGLMVDVPAEEISEYYPSVTPEGARAAAAFADRYARPARTVWHRFVDGLWVWSGMRAWDRTVRRLLTKEDQ